MCRRQKGHQSPTMSARNTGLRPRYSESDTLPAPSTAGSVKSGAISPGVTGGRDSSISMVTLLRVSSQLAEKWEHHQRLGLEACALADLLRLRQIRLRPSLVSGVEVQRGQPVV